MKVTDYVQQAKKEKSGALADLPDKKADTLVRKVLELIGQEIDSAQEGVVKIGGLGSFRVRQVEREVEGEKKLVKQIVFRRPDVKDKEKSTDD